MLLQMARAIAIQSRKMQVISIFFQKEVHCIGSLLESRKFLPVYQTVFVEASMTLLRNLHRPPSKIKDRTLLQQFKLFWAISDQFFSRTPLIERNRSNRGASCLSCKQKMSPNILDENGIAAGHSIDAIHKWLPIHYSIVLVQISLPRLIVMC